MPGGDRTGPTGMGPMTGRAAGYCAWYATPGFANLTPGRGLGMGFRRGFGRGMGGRGRGFGRGRMDPYPGGYYGIPSVYPYAPGMTSEQEVDLLKAQAENMQKSLEDINSRVAELQAATQKED